MSSETRQEPNVWHNLSIDNVLKSLESTQDGLSSVEAQKRLIAFGKNQLIAQKPVSSWRLLLEQFKNILMITLLLATVVSAFLGHTTEAIAIFVIMSFAVILGFLQEMKAEKAIEALKKMAAPNATVFRDSLEAVIPATDLVPGDVFLLNAGDRVPADARLIYSQNLKVDESVLTGESIASEKNHTLIFEKNTIPGDRLNTVFAGTSVSYGRGKAVIVQTAMETEFGKIAKMLQSFGSEKTPLQKNLDNLGKILARAAIVIVTVIAGLGLYRGQPFMEMLIFGIALAVAVVPEALPAVVTISLAIGVQRMVKKNALMRRLSAVETLGGTTIICSDKTGTLTRDEMTIKIIYTSGVWIDVSGSGYIPEGDFKSKDGAIPSEVLKEFLIAGSLCNDARLINDNGIWKIHGDATEAAFIVAARKAGLDEQELSRKFPRVSEIPFSSETRTMMTMHSNYDNNHFNKTVFIKGAPEKILAQCNQYKTDHGVKPLNEIQKIEILARAQTMAKNALRVLAIAYRHGGDLDNRQSELVFLGLAGMLDPPRTEALDAVQKCFHAGIRPVMITGDHPVTAEAIARDLGILSSGRIVIGSELESMTDQQLAESISDVQVFARVSPEHKLRIVQAFQKNGHIVAMTGDGVNDAPALKKADIGISMGISGTDVTREASAMMLTDDNFASIVSAVEEGRGIYDNIKKYLTYLLSSNIGEIGLMASATLMGIPLPLSAVQILYVNLATDGLPALALSVDPPDPDIMNRKPNDPQKGIFTKPILALMLTGGIWSTLVNIALFQWARTSGRSLSEAMTMTFVSLVLIQFFKAYNFRSDRDPVFKKPFANKWLNLAIFWELCLLGLIIYLPFFHESFGTFGLPLEDWFIILGSATTIVPVLESVKWLIRRDVFEKK